MAQEVVRYAKEALEHCEAAMGCVTDNVKELEYYLTDITAIYDMAMFYAKKLEAAHGILQYKYTMDENLRGNLQLLEDAVAPWEESLDWYRRLAKLTKKPLCYANSMQTPQRFRFRTVSTLDIGASACQDERELANYKEHLTEMKAGKYPCDRKETEEETEPLPQASFILHSENCRTYTIAKGEQVFTDMPSQILTFAPIKGLYRNRFWSGRSHHRGRYHTA